MAAINVAADAALTQDNLKAILRYVPETGQFYWVEWRPGVRRGKPAGCVWKAPRADYRIIVIRIDGRLYKAHRLAWLYMTGAWPVGEMDHRNNDPLDNRWTNLREATRTENNRNMRMRSRNSTGEKGVSLSRGGRYVASITVMRKTIYLGTFDILEEAAEAYRSAAAKYHGDFANAGA